MCFMDSLRVLKKSFPHYKSMEANDPQGMANLDTRGIAGKIYVGDHKTLLYTKYICCDPHGYRCLNKGFPIICF